MGNIGGGLVPFSFSEKAMRLFLSLFIFLCCGAGLRAQTTLTIAAYNVCNLFDTLNDPGIHDLVLSPTEYGTKTANLARVIGELGADVIALCEVENAGVLRDLLALAPLDTIPYRFVHYDSPDSRGIDVALLYRADRMEPVSSEPVAAPEGYRTRDILRAEFTVRGTRNRLVAYAVHLPSRRGGYGNATRMRELIAAQLGDLAAREAPDTGVIVMGDFNDNPASRLVRRHLSELDCATLEPYRKGVGSYAWRDTWLMYDNIFLSGALKCDGAARIYRRDWMLTRSGRFAGYPDRETLSDHLPVYLRVRL